MYADGYRLVVSRAEIDYRYTLQSGDRFKIDIRFERQSRIRFVFHQEIILLNNHKEVLSAKIIGTCLKSNGRPGFPKGWDAVFKGLS